MGQPSGETGPVFSSAEKFFFEGKLSAAKEQYAAFLSNNPQLGLIDDALYRLGEIAKAQNDFRIALRYFDIVSEQFRNSELAELAKLEKAFCKFSLKENQEAVGLLKEFLTKNFDPDLRRRAYMLLGDCWSSLDDPAKAVENYRNALPFAPKEKEEVAGLIQKAIEKEKDLEKLLNFSKSGTDAFPYGDALFRLLSLCFDERNFSKFSEYAPLFLQHFPGHSKHGVVTGLLAGLKANPYQYKTKIGIILPLTGNAALQGEMILRGVQLAFSSISSGEDIELAIKDSAGDPHTARAAMEELARDTSVIAILGPVFSKVAEEVAPLSKKMEIPMLSPASPSYSIAAGNKNPFFFRNGITGIAQGAAMAEFAMNNLDLKRFAVICQDDNFGRELSGSFIENVAAMGGEVVAVEKYSADVVDFKDLIKKVGGMEDDDLKKEAVSHAKNLKGRESTMEDGDRLSVPIYDGVGSGVGKDQIRAHLNLGYEAIFVPGFYEKIALVLPQLEFFNIENVKLLGTSGWNSGDIANLSRSHARDLYFVDGFFLDSESKPARDFVEQYKSFFGEPPDVLSAQAYDAANMLLKIHQSGKRNRQGMREGLLEIKDFPGVSGRTSFTVSGDSEKELFVLTVRKNKIVETKGGESHGD